MLPEGWAYEPLSNFVQIKHGFAFKSEYFAERGEFVVLTPGNFRMEGGYRDLASGNRYYSSPPPNEYILDRNDLLVVMTEQAPGLLGSSILVPENDRFLHNQRLGLVEFADPSRLDKAYLYHLFNSALLRKPISIGASGTKVRHTSPSKICSIYVPIPQLQEQRRIARVLDTWDAAIRAVEQVIAAKRERKRGLMQVLLTGKRRFKEFVLTSAFQKTRYGAIPADWKYVSLSSIASEVSARNVSGEDYPVLSCTKHRGLVDSLEYFGKRVYSANTSSYKIVHRGEFAYATNHIEEGSIGYQDIYDAALVSPMYTVFRTRAERVDNAYLFSLLKTEHYRQVFASMTSGSVNRRGSLRWKDFRTIKVPLPAMSEQRKISSFLSTADTEIENLESQLEAYRLQMRGLKQELLTGKKRLAVDESEAVTA